MNQNEFATAVFTPLQQRLERLRTVILEHAPRDRPIRFLDLGCGCGNLVFHLAEALPHAQLTGIDISAPSIAVAEETRLRSPHRERIRFHAADYIQYQAAPFDVIFAWSVLHWISAPTDALLGKIGTDLKPYGVFINGMPYECLYNRGLHLLRRVFRLCRNRWTDGLFYLLAKMVHGSRYSAASLRERISYMYHLPQRFDGPRLRSRFAQVGGVGCIAEYEDPPVSAAQLRSNLVVFRKSTEPARETPADLLFRSKREAA